MRASLPSLLVASRRAAPRYRPATPMRIALLSAVLVVLVLGPTAAAGPLQSGCDGPCTLKVTVIGSGGVTSSPGGISCPGKCSAQYTGGKVSLFASPGAGWNFGGWGGDCSGGGDCAVGMSQNRNVTATFVDGAEAAVHAQRHDQRQRLGGEQPGRNRLPGHLLGNLQPGHEDHARTDRRRRRRLRHLGRGLLRGRHLRRHAQRGRVGRGNLRGPPHAATRDAARAGHGQARSRDVGASVQARSAVHVLPGERPLARRALPRHAEAPDRPGGARFLRCAAEGRRDPLRRRPDRCCRASSTGPGSSRAGTRPS